MSNTTDLSLRGAQELVNAVYLHLSFHELINHFDLYDEVEELIKEKLSRVPLNSLIEKATSENIPPFNKNL